MMGRLMALAGATFREGVRSQVFINLVLFAIMAAGAGTVLDQLSLGERGRVLLDLGLTALSAVNALLITMLVARSMGGDEDRHTLLTIMVRPVGRAEVLSGKFLGVLLLATCNVAGGAVCLWLAGGVVGADVGVELAWSCLGLILEAAVVTALAFLFATFAGSTVAGMFTLGLYTVGVYASGLRTLALKEDVGPVRYVARVAYHMVPNLQRLDLHAHRGTPEEMFMTVVYAAAYAGMALALGAFIFDRRDLR